MREHGCVMSHRPAHGAEASSSHAVPPAPGVAIAHLEQELGDVGVLLAHFDEAQAEQVLWQEFRDHDASINNTLNEALRVHGGPSWRIFQVHIFRRIGRLLPHPLLRLHISNFASPRVLVCWQ
jgi:hypothetical protein